jgi:hypothetical protein
LTVARFFLISRCTRREHAVLQLVEVLNLTLNPS